MFPLCVSSYPQVISSSQPIVSTHDNDAILPCHVEPLVEDHEWWRLDLPPDPEDPQSQHRHVPFKTETWEDGAVQGGALRRRNIQMFPPRVTKPSFFFSLC